MSQHHPPFPDGHPGHDPDGPLDLELLLEIAAWVDGTLPPDRVRTLEARLADDPAARALAASARLRPLMPADAAAPLPAALVARASALVPGPARVSASDSTAPAADHPRVTVTLTAPLEGDRASGSDRSRWRFPLRRTVEAAGALAACVGAAAIGWQLGGSAGQTTVPIASSAPATRAIVVDGDIDETEGALLAAASFGVFEDAPEDPLEFLLLADALSGSTGAGVGSGGASDGDGGDGLGGILR